MGLLRFSLALCVLFEHLHGVSFLGMRFGRGDLAVQCFYMISGFYMALVLNEKYTGPGSYRQFIQQRYLRLYPTYFVILVFTLLVQFFAMVAIPSPSYAVVYWLHYAPQFTFSTWIALLVSNFTLLGLDWTAMFAALNPHTGQLQFTAVANNEILSGIHFTLLGPAWTLGVELTFYIVAPFFVRKPWPFQALVVLMSFGLRAFAAHFYGFEGQSWTYRFFFFEIGLFLSGSLAYHVYRHHTELLQRFVRFLPWFKWPFFICLAFYTRLGIPWAIRYDIFAVWALLLLPSLFLTTKSQPFDRLLGELSYPMYLMHWALLPLLRGWINVFPDGIAGIVYVAIVVGMSLLVYYYIEEPMENFRHHLFARQRQKSA